MKTMRAKLVVRIGAAAAACLGLLPLTSSATMTVTTDTATTFTGTFSVVDADGWFGNSITPTNFVMDSAATANSGCKYVQAYRLWTSPLGFLGSAQQAYVNVGCQNESFSVNWYGTAPAATVTTDVAARTFAELGGSFWRYDDESGLTQTRYFRFFDLHDTGGPTGTFSGSFCFSTNDQTCAAPVRAEAPEPGTLALLAFGLATVGAGTVLRRRAR
jgi:hypothetical protein